ncbi:MAG: SocA family protein [Proteobacteria bacterium]|nr:SocA family protein [Pseudomonadota bacterium]
MCIHLSFDHKKATQALNYFARKNGGNIDKLRVIKLIFFADRYHLRKYGQPITKGEYFAMEHGPVNSGTKDIADMTDFLSKQESEYASQFIRAVTDGHKVESCADVDTSIFSESDLEALEFAWNEFGKFSAFKLRDISHNYPEWKKHEEPILKGYSSRMRMDYEDFFEDVDNNSVNQCHELTEEDRDVARHYLKETAQIASLLN